MDFTMLYNSEISKARRADMTPQRITAVSALSIILLLAKSAGALSGIGGV